MRLDAGGPDRECCDRLGAGRGKYRIERPTIQRTGCAAESGRNSSLPDCFKLRLAGRARCSRLSGHWRGNLSIPGATRAPASRCPNIQLAIPADYSERSASTAFTLAARAAGTADAITAAARITRAEA